VFERFTERARQAVVQAQAEARALDHHYIGTEHLLLGLLREEQGVGGRVLRELGVTLEAVREGVERIIGRGDAAPVGQIPFTPRAKKALEFSLREALRLGHNYIGTEHLLLGLARDSGGVSSRILLEFDIDEERVREAVLASIPPGLPRGLFRRRRVELHGAAEPAWEFRIEHRTALDAETTAWLNGLGAEGWSVAAAIPDTEGTTLILQRECRPSAARAESA